MGRRKQKFPLLSVAYDRGDAKNKPQARRERNWASRQICFVAVVLFWREILPPVLLDKCLTRKKCLYIFFVAMCVFAQEDVPPWKSEWVRRGSKEMPTFLNEFKSKRFEFRKHTNTCTRPPERATAVFKRKSFLSYRKLSLRLKKYCSTYKLYMRLQSSCFCAFLPLMLPRLFLFFFHANVKTHFTMNSTIKTVRWCLKSDSIKCEEGRIRDFHRTQFVITISWFNLKYSQITRTVLPLLLRYVLCCSCCCRLNA